MNVDKYGRMILICSFSAAGIIVLGKRAFECAKDEFLRWIISSEIEEELSNSVEEDDKDEEQDQQESMIYIDDLYVCKFEDATKAQKYANKYGEFVVTLYKIECFTYVYITQEKIAKKAKFYSGSVVVNEKEREKCIDLAFKNTSMIFEFDEREYAEFFLKKSGIKKFVIWQGYIVVDASDVDEEKYAGLSQLAEECYGMEIIDTYTIEKVKEILSRVTEKGEGLT